MWSQKGYESALQENGFWEEENQAFSGHCHQCTPALGLALNTLGFRVSYLEGFRVEERIVVSGKPERVSPEEEANRVMRGQFCAIGRIPYCCLEVSVKNEPFYISGKHIKPDQLGRPSALLTPVCYRNLAGAFCHPLNRGKSGIYLDNIIPAENSKGTDFSKMIVWRKQTEKDTMPEYFASYLRMNLVD